MWGAVGEYAVNEYPGEATPITVLYGHCMNASDALFFDMHAHSRLAFKMNARDNLYFKMNAKSKVCHGC